MSSRPRLVAVTASKSPPPGHQSGQAPARARRRLPSIARGPPTTLRLLRARWGGGRLAGRGVARRRGSRRRGFCRAPRRESKAARA
eukprot:1137198-Prymnesium_polylepis.1